MKILLVDDHALFREGLVLLLGTVVPGARVLEARSTEEALAVLGGDPDVELVLIDLAMPGTPGIEGIPLIKERQPGIPVVALSSSDDRRTVLAAIDAGAMGFIPKSSSSGVLAGALKLIMSKGIYLPAEVFLEAHEQSEEPLKRAGATRPERILPSELGLTPRQADVLYLILQGQPAKLICRELGLSPSTVKSHTSAVLRALNVTTRTQAVIAAGKLGMRFERAAKR